MRTPKKTTDEIVAQLGSDVQLQSKAEAQKRLEEQIAGDLEAIQITEAWEAHRIAFGYAED